MMDQFQTLFSFFNPRPYAKELLGPAEDEEGEEIEEEDEETRGRARASPH